MTKTFISLEDVLGRDAGELAELATGTFLTEKLGWVPFTAIDQSEYKQIKKDAVTHVPDGTGGMTRDIDDDKMMIRVIIAAVGKDPRSTFTFADKQLLTKLGVATADDVVGKLLAPGEILNLAVEIQNASGFGDNKQKENRDAVKNS